MAKYINANKLYEYLEQVSRYYSNSEENAVNNVISGIKIFIASLPAYTLLSSNMEKESK